MNIKAFENKLNDLGLTKKEFANMVGAAYNGVVNWNTKGKTPNWVDSWLENYEKSKVLQETSSFKDIQKSFSFFSDLGLTMKIKIEELKFEKLNKKS